MSVSLITISEKTSKVVSRDFKIFNNKIFICSHFYQLNRWVAQISCYDLLGNTINTFGKNGKVLLTGFQNTTESFQLKLSGNFLYVIGTSQKLSRDGFILKLNNTTGQTINNFGLNGIVMFDIFGKNDFVSDFLLENENLIILGYSSLNGYFSLFLMRINILTGKINPITSKNTSKNSSKNTIFNEFNIDYRNGIMLIYKRYTDIIPKSLIISQDSIIICGGIKNNTWDGFIINISKNYLMINISIQNYLNTYDMNNSIIFNNNKLVLLTTVTNLLNLNVVILSQYNNANLLIDNGFKQFICSTMNFDLAGKKILVDNDKYYILCNSNNSVFIFCYSSDNTYTTFQYTSKKSIMGNNFEILNNNLYVEIDLDLNALILCVDKNKVNTKIEL